MARLGAADMEPGNALNLGEFPDVSRWLADRSLPP